LTANYNEELRAPFKAVVALVRAIVLFGSATFPAWYWPAFYIYIIQPYIANPAIAQVQPFGEIPVYPVFLLIGGLGMWGWWHYFGSRLGHWIMYKSR
jgi:hypothetical protein